MTRWEYRTEIIKGNLHTVAALLTDEHPDWDVVTVHESGLYAVILYRIRKDR